jgi:hypothetical protein
MSFAFFALTARAHVLCVCPLRFHDTASNIH